MPTSYDDLAMNYLRLFTNEYEIITRYHFDEIQREKVLKDKSVECRFCKKSHPYTSFKHKAHAIPQFIGNKYLVSRYECDACNELFSKTIENEMANFMKLLHCLNGVKGEKKIPIYKTKQARLESDRTNINIENIDDLSIIGDKNGKSFCINLNNDPFIPIAVYKCLTKIALSIIPESELIHFDKSFEWLQEKEHSISKFQLGDLLIIHSQVLEPIEFPFISVNVCKKRESSSLSLQPSYVSRISYSKNSFQIHIPLCSLDDKIFSKVKSILYMPHLIDITTGIHASETKVVNFSSTERCEVPVKIEITNLEL